MKKIIFLLIIITLSSNIFSQDDFKFSAQIRPRFIIDNKDFNSKTSFETYGEMRSRFGIQFKPTKGLSLFFQVQDSRTFGEEPGTISNNKNLDVHQAYLQVNNLFDLPLNMKAGRMEAAYGTERIMSKNNWNNIGRSFDGLTLQISICTTNKSYLDLFAFRVGERGFPEDSLDENVLGIFADLQIFEGHKIQPFIVYRSSASASYPFNAFSVGTYLTGEIKKFSHQAEIITQFGDERENSRQSLSAFFAGYNAAYKFDCDKQPYISAGIDFYSGDDDLTDNKYKEFSRWFGAGHKYLGYMDFFPNNTFGIGLMDLHVKAGLLPIKKLGIKTAVHIFESAEDFTLVNNSASSNFGTEIDIVLTYDYYDNLLFEMGGGLFLPGAIFEEKLGADNSTWFYIMAVADL